MDSRIRLRWLAMGPEAGGGQCSRWMALFRRSCVLGPVARCAIEDEIPGSAPTFQGDRVFFFWEPPGSGVPPVAPPPVRSICRSG